MALKSVPLHLSCRLPSGTGRLQLSQTKASPFPDWTIPIFSAFPDRRGAPSLWSFWWPSFVPDPSGPCPPCAGKDSWCSPAGGVSEVQGRWAESPHSCCWPWCSGCSPVHVWLSEQPVPIARSCPASHPPALSPSQNSLIWKGKRWSSTMSLINIAQFQIYFLYTDPGFSATHIAQEHLGRQLQLLQGECSFLLRSCWIWKWVFIRKDNWMFISYFISDYCKQPQRIMSLSTALAVPLYINC